MRELTTADLAPYLPFDLKVQGQTLGQIEVLDTLSNTSINIKGRGTQYGMWADISDIKPILRPLSDIYKNIDGEVHANILYRRFDITDLGFNGNITNPKYGYFAYLYLIENHFDVFDLISEGLAIDINTIDLC